MELEIASKCDSLHLFRRPNPDASHRISPEGWPRWPPMQAFAVRKLLRNVHRQSTLTDWAYLYIHTQSVLPRTPLPPLSPLPLRGAKDGGNRAGGAATPEPNKRPFNYNVLAPVVSIKLERRKELVGPFKRIFGFDAEE